MLYARIPSHERSFLSSRVMTTATPRDLKTTDTTLTTERFGGFTYGYIGLRD